VELPADLSRLSLEPIGVLRCQQQTRVEAPRQPAAATHLEGVIELLPGRHYEHALEDLQGWERLWVIFWFHRNTGWRPKVLPPRSDSGRKGVFSTRSPHRPNPLGLSVLRLSHVEGLNVHVRDVDLLDGTPILDIKPYVPYSDAFPASGQGWLQPADPRPDHEVLFSAEAELQMLWIEAHDMRVPLRDRVIGTLRLGPQPHPYRRIQKRRDGQLQLAVKDWRLPFAVEGRRITVLRVESGYQAGQLDADRPDPDGRLALHRAFSALRTCA
jgi:tRNA-Thr(GGU) m(6)t(6)A37 methyltransferase TsaA